MKKVGWFCLLLWLASGLFSACSNDDDDSGDDNASIDDDDDDDNDNNDDNNDNDDNDNDDNDNDDNDNDNNDNDDNDDDTTPYWAEGEDLGAVTMAEYRPLGDQGLNEWVWVGGIAAKDALLESASVRWIATLDVETDLYYLWHPDGEVVFTRTIGADGLEYGIVDQTGPDPFPNQDPLFAVGYDAELALFENPDGIQLPEHGYDADDPRVGWIPDDQACYPRALERITQIFDSPEGPDLAFDVHASHGGGTGSHGNLGLMQSRATLLFSGAGIIPGEVIDDAARQADIAPTLLALLGADVVEGIDARGHRVTNNFLQWQDGRALAEVMTDPSSKGLADQVVVFVFDGLASNELFYHYEHQGSGGWDLPNMFSLIDDGTYFRGGAIVGWPSFSLPGHTSLGTGVYQGHHGLLSNDNYLRVGREMFSYDWFVEHVQEILRDPAIGLEYYLKFFAEERGVETVYQATHRSFGDWDLLRPGSWRDAYTACVNEMTFYGADYSYYSLLELAAGLLPDNGKFDPQVYSLADMTVPLQFQLMFLDPTHQTPKVTLASFYVTDLQGESNGPHSEALRAELVNMDRYIGVILDLYAQAGVLDRTTFVLTSDHGMELLRPGVFDDWRPALQTAGIKYFALGGQQQLYLEIMRVQTDPASAPAGAPVEIAVTVTSDDDGSAVVGATVNLTGGDCAPCAAVTDDAGQTEFTVTPNAGEDLLVQATHADFTLATATVAVTD